MTFRSNLNATPSTKLRISYKSFWLKGLNCTSHLNAVPAISKVIRRGMSPLAASLSIFLFFSSFAAAAQINAPGPGCTSSTVEWVCFFNAFLFISPLPPIDELTAYPQTLNTLNQNACMVAAFLLSTCNGGCEYGCLHCVYNSC